MLRLVAEQGYETVVFIKRLSKRIYHAHAKDGAEKAITFLRPLVKRKPIQSVWW